MQRNTQKSKQRSQRLDQEGSSPPRRQDGTSSEESWVEGIWVCVQVRPLGGHLQGTCHMLLFSSEGPPGNREVPSLTLLRLVAPPHLPESQKGRRSGHLNA